MLESNLEFMPLLTRYRYTSVEDRNNFGLDRSISEVLTSVAKSSRRKQYKEQYKLTGEFYENVNYGSAILLLSVNERISCWIR